MVDGFSYIVGVLFEYVMLDDVYPKCIYEFCYCVFDMFIVDYVQRAIG